MNHMNKNNLSKEQLNLWDLSTTQAMREKPPRYLLTFFVVLVQDDFRLRVYRVSGVEER